MIDLKYVVICINSHKYVVTRIEKKEGVKEYIAVSDYIAYITDAEILCNKLNEGTIGEPLALEFQCCIKEAKC